MGWGMAGGGADPAALLRLYMRFGRLDDALALAHLLICAWLTQACTMPPRLLRVCACGEHNAYFFKASRRLSAALCIFCPSLLSVALGTLPYRRTFGARPLGLTASRQGVFNTLAETPRMSPGRARICSASARRPPGSRMRCWRRWPPRPPRPCPPRLTSPRPPPSCPPRSLTCTAPLPSTRACWSAAPQPLRVRSGLPQGVQGGSTGVQCSDCCLVV